MLARRHCSTTLSSPVATRSSQIGASNENPNRLHARDRPPQSAAGDWTYPDHRRPPGCLLIGLGIPRSHLSHWLESSCLSCRCTDFDPSVPASLASELESITSGADWLRVAMERMFVDAVSAQHQGLQKVLQNFPADVVIGDDMLFGVLPMLLGPDAKRRAIARFGK